MSKPETYLVPESVLGQMLLGAFRYALGRQTYIVSQTCEWMRTYWSALAPWHKQIQRDIRKAIERKEAGADCDVVDWQKILALKPMPGKEG